VVTPQWPARAIGAITSLFRPLQDIDVYVEDQGSEAFYRELLRRVLPSDVRVERVLPLNGRQNVIAAAMRHDFTNRPALFIVDGDFEWVRGEPAPATAKELRFGQWVAGLSAFLRLFAAWAVLNKVDPDVPTVSIGIGNSNAPRESTACLGQRCPA
jgi:hypothetical protein